MDPSDAAERLQVSLRVLAAFTACYKDYKVWRVTTAVDACNVTPCHGML